MATFQELYRKIAVTKNYLQPQYPRMDNWAVDQYELPLGEITYFAGMSDGGYCRYIGMMVLGKVDWRVDESYGPQGTVYKFSGITEEGLAAIAS